MRIAINTRFLLSDKMEGFGWYTYEVCSRMVKAHPEHEFIFFFDRSFDEKFVFADNVTPVVLRPPARHPILFKIWFNRSVTKALKKHNADVFFSPDGFLSLKTDVPQIGTIHDINFEHHPEDLPSGALKYLKKYFPQFARKAAHLLTVSNYSKQDIVNTYGIDEDKITVAWNGASEAYRPIPEDDQQIVRDAYTKGKKYLLFVGSIHPRKNLNRLLKAYDKLLEKSIEEYELLIVGSAMWKNSGELEISDRCKNHVHFSGHLSLEDLSKAMASASVFCFVPYFEGFGIPLVEAMQSGTPILSGDRTSLPEVAGDAALYCNPFSANDISEKLKQLLLDTKLQESLHQKGLERSKEFSWDRSSEIAWQVIQQTLNRK